jgi:hypothetical protein
MTVMTWEGDAEIPMLEVVWSAMLGASFAQSSLAGTLPLRIIRSDEGGQAEKV